MDREVERPIPVGVNVVVTRLNGDVLERFADLWPRPAVLLTANLDAFAEAWRAWQRGGDELIFKPLMHPSELHVAIVTALENTICPRRRQAPAPALARSA